MCNILLDKGTTCLYDIGHDEIFSFRGQLQNQTLCYFFQLRPLSHKALTAVLTENFVTAPSAQFDRATGKAVYALVQTLLLNKTDLSPCVLLYEYFDDRPYESYCDIMKRLGYRMLEVKTARKSTLYLFGKSVPKKEIRTHAATEIALREQYGY